MIRRDWTTCLAWLPRPSQWPGVTARLRQLAKAAHRGGLPIRIVAAVGGATDLGSHVITVRSDLSAGSVWPIVSRLARYRMLSAAVPSDSSRIILRMPGAADPSLLEFLRRWGSRTVSEHHGDEIAERMRAAQGALDQARAGIEAVGLHVLLHGVPGALGVTPELADLLSRRGPPGLRTGWTGNGIDVTGVQATGHLRYHGGTLEVVALIGTTAAWHGLDRIVAGLARHRGRHIRLHLVGDMAIPAVSPPTPDAEIVHHGRLTGRSLDAVLGSMHLGVASLAMHRAGLVQACPLKSREYAARGLPFVYAYDDPGIPADLPWCLRVPGGDGPLEIESLFGFAETLPTDSGERLRAYASMHLDWRQVLERMHGLATDMTA